MPAADPDSILDSTKQALGLDPDYQVFDLDIKLHINSVFSTLNRLGVGPVGGFRIVDASSKWDDFTRGRTELNEVQSYMFLRVRLLFDPPTMGYLVAAIKEQIKEHEFSLQVMSSNPDIVDVMVTPMVFFLNDPNPTPGTFQTTEFSFNESGTDSASGSFPNTEFFLNQDAPTNIPTPPTPTPTPSAFPKVPIYTLGDNSG